MDLLVFSIFILIFLSVGKLSLKKSNKTEEDYLTGSRSFGSILVALSAGATSSSGFIMIGLVGIGYTAGFSGIWMIVSFFIGEYIYWTFFSRRLNILSRKSGTLTVSSFLGTDSLKREKSSQKIISISAILTLIFVGGYCCAQLSCAAKTLDSFFGLDESTGVFITMGLILVYSLKGGLRSSVWTDVAQAVVMILICTIAAFTICSDIGGFFEGYSKLRAVDVNLVSLTNCFQSYSFILTCLTFAFLGFSFHLSQPHVLIRILSGKNSHEIRKAKWIYLAFGYYLMFAMLLFGAFVRLEIPEIDDPEKAFPLFAVNRYGSLIKGFILAGIFSAIASTADSQLLVCSSSVSKDLYPKFGKFFKDKYGMLFTYSSTFLVAVVIAFSTIKLSSSVFEIILFSISVLACSIGVVVFIRALKIQSTSNILAILMLVGSISAILWKKYGYTEYVSESLLVFPLVILLNTLLFKVSNKETSSREVPQF